MTTDSLQLFLKDVGKVSLLTAQEEVGLAKRIERGDLDAKKKMVNVRCVSTSAPTTHSLPELLIELIAQRFRVLGEPMRIKMLDRLRVGPATVSELQQALGATQQNVSKHLGILHSAGIVSRTKHGNHTRCQISDPDVFDLCDQVCGSIRRQIGELEAILHSTP